MFRAIELGSGKGLCLEPRSKRNIFVKHDDITFSMPKPFVKKRISNLCGSFMMF